jgi:glycerol-3-phosphate acyltransferase PlsY
MSAIASLASLVPFYLLGAFPTGRLIAKVYGIDLSSQGSGNVGATNVARVIGRRAGIFTLIGDVAKGSIGVWLAQILVSEPWFASAAGVALVLGHCLSIPGYSRGGKGVATALGVISMLLPSSGALALIVFGGVFWIWRIVSLASVAATLAVPAWGLVIGASDSVSLSLMAQAAIIVMRHEQNLRRLIEGREPKFTARKSGGTDLAR